MITLIKNTLDKFYAAVFGGKSEEIVGLSEHDMSTKGEAELDMLELIQGEGEDAFVPQQRIANGGDIGEYEDLLEGLRHEMTLQKDDLERIFAEKAERSLEGAAAVYDAAYPYADRERALAEELKLANEASIDKAEEFIENIEDERKALLENTDEAKRELGFFESQLNSLRENAQKLFSGTFSLENMRDFLDNTLTSLLVGESEELDVIDKLDADADVDEKTNTSTSRTSSLKNTVWEQDDPFLTGDFEEFEEINAMSQGIGRMRSETANVNVMAASSEVDLLIAQLEQRLFEEQLIAPEKNYFNEG